MGDKVKVGYSINEETNQHIKKIAEFTHRTDSGVIDWLVADGWDRMKLMIVSTETPTTKGLSTEEMYAAIKAAGLEV